MKIDKGGWGYVGYSARGGGAVEQKLTFLFRRSILLNTYFILFFQSKP